MLDIPNEKAPNSKLKTFDFWNLEFGIWFLEFGFWNLEFGI